VCKVSLFIIVLNNTGGGKGRWNFFGQLREYQPFSFELETLVCVCVEMKEKEDNQAQLNMPENH
jgi:hypothetical protein